MANKMYDVYDEGAVVDIIIWKWLKGFGPGNINIDK